MKPFNHRRATIGRHCLEAVLIALVILKLTGLVSWSWWIITIPLWGTALFAFVLYPAIKLAIDAARKERTK